MTIKEKLQQAINTAANNCRRHQDTPTHPDYQYWRGQHDLAMTLLTGVVVEEGTYIITHPTGTYVYAGTLIAAQTFADQLFGAGQATVTEVQQGSYQRIETAQKVSE